jgi:hypothetical protein
MVRDIDEDQSRETYRDTSEGLRLRPLAADRYRIALLA